MRFLLWWENWHAALLSLGAPEADDPAIDETPFGVGLTAADEVEILETISTRSLPLLAGEAGLSMSAVAFICNPDKPELPTNVFACVAVAVASGIIFLFPRYLTAWRHRKDPGLRPFMRYPWWPALAQVLTGLAMAFIVF